MTTNNDMNTTTTPRNTAAEMAQAITTELQKENPSIEVLQEASDYLGAWAHKNDAEKVVERITGNDQFALDLKALFAGNLSALKAAQNYFASLAEEGEPFEEDKALLLAL